VRRKCDRDNNHYRDRVSLFFLYFFEYLLTYTSAGCKDATVRKVGSSDITYNNSNDRYIHMAICVRLFLYFGFHLLYYLSFRLLAFSLSSLRSSIYTLFERYLMYNVSHLTRL
jgi:hypothetical protein